MVPNTSALWTAESSCSMNVPLLWREMVKRHIRVPHSLYRVRGTIRRQRPPSGGPYWGVIHSRERSAEVVLKPNCRGLGCSIGDARRCRLTILCPVYRGQAETVMVTTRATDSWIVKRHRAFRPIAVNLANDVRWLGRLLVRVQSGEQTRRSEAYSL